MDVPQSEHQELEEAPLGHGQRLHRVCQLLRFCASSIKNNFSPFPIQSFLYSILDLCLAQIRFVINVPKQVMKPKGYIATLIMLILIIRS